MPIVTRTLSTLAIALGVTCLQAAETPKDSALTQAGSPSTAATKLENLEFSGVSTVGKKTVINLFDKQEKRNFWIEAGATSGGITVVNYDSAHDQVTIRQNGTEKLLPLRAPSAVVNGTLPAPAPLPAATGATGAPTGTPTPTTQLSQARQEEEARMLVSDLLEIGMAQRRAYEEAQRKAAGGQPAAQPSTDVTQPAAPATPAGTPQPVDPNTTAAQSAPPPAAPAR